VVPQAFPPSLGLEGLMSHYHTCATCEHLRKANAYYGIADLTLPNTFLEDATPFEVWSQLEDTISHLMNCVYHLSTVVETMHMEGQHE
jgi:hypothetical protein